MIHTFTHYISIQRWILHSHVLCMCSLFIFFGQGCSSLLQTSPDKHVNKPRIALLPLLKSTSWGSKRSKRQRSIQTEQIHYINDLLYQDVADYLHNRFILMTRENMETLLPPGRSLEDCEGTCEVETGQLLAADWIITGGITKFGSSLRVSLKLHNTKTSAFVKGERAGGKSVEELEKPIQQAALSLVLSISKGN